jgi:hypothetical protein
MNLPWRKANKGCSTWAGFALKCQYQTRLERLASDKCSRLFGLFIKDNVKKLYNIGSRAQCYKTFFSVIYGFS